MVKIDKNIVTRDFLISEYIEQNKPIDQIARDIGVSRSRVFQILNEWGIPKRKPQWYQRDGVIPTRETVKEWLHAECVIKGKSDSQISRESGIVLSSIQRWKKKYGIPRTKPIYQDKIWLLDQYVTKKKSTPVIANEMGVDPSVIMRWLKRNGIKMRSNSESQLLCDRPDISGEKHPMFGCKGALNPNWNGGLTPLRQKMYASLEWRRAAIHVKKRDKCCALCPSTDKLVIHHIDRFVEAFFFACDPGNLIRLCKKHHDKIRGKENRWKRRLFKIVQQRELEFMYKIAA